MHKGVLVPVAALLAACGVAANSTNDAAESAPQESNKAKQQPVMSHYDQGGSAGCFDPNLTGQARAAAERIGVPCDTPSDAGQSGGDPWEGEYTGQAQMRITRASAGRYSVYIDSGGPGCGGEIEGSATANANRLTLSVPVQTGYQQCRIAFDRRGGSLQATSTGDCYLFHGGQCEFDGTYRRMQSASASPPAPTSSRPWIVGAWVARGFECGGDGVIYQADGTYASDAQSGRWQLSGNTLIETALQEVEMGEGETPIRNPRPVRSQILSVASNRNAFSMRTADGEVWNMVRCR